MPDLVSRWPKISRSTKLTLKRTIEVLPRGYVVVADTAYKPTEHIVSMYGDGDKKRRLPALQQLQLFLLVKLIS